MRDDPDPRQKVTKQFQLLMKNSPRVVKAAYIQLPTDSMSKWTPPSSTDRGIGEAGQHGWCGQALRGQRHPAYCENAIKVRSGTLQPEDFFDAKTRVAKLDEAPT